VQFRTGTHSLCTRDTNSAGVTRCVLSYRQTVLVIRNGGIITANYAGNAQYQPSHARAGRRGLRWFAGRHGARVELGTVRLRTTA
jgi:hypothetical protein